jgi:hypothetical protein
LDLQRLKERMAINANLTLDSGQFGSFWQWKFDVERIENGSILDNKHVAETSRRLLNILPSWQTYRGADCDYFNELPRSLTNIQWAYEIIRNTDLLNFDSIPVQPLKEIWHELGRVKELYGKRRIKRDYFIVSVGKPFMFIWGQTLSLDSINRQEISRSYSSSRGKLRKNRWDFTLWYDAMLHLQQQLNADPNIIKYCKQLAESLFGKDATIPWGRFCDIYYFKSDFDPTFKEVFLDIWYEESQYSWNQAYHANSGVGKQMLFWLWETDRNVYYKYYVLAVEEMRV